MSDHVKVVEDFAEHGVMSPERRAALDRLLFKHKEVREALRYVLEVREIECLHSPEGGGDCCAKCLAEEALEVK